MNDPVCKECAHFCQHYGFSEGRVFRICCGHCIQGKGKAKRPYTKACAHFLPGKAAEEEFAGKKYLTKQLLEYILRLDLLPGIEDAPAGTALDMACCGKKEKGS